MSRIDKACKDLQAELNDYLEKLDIEIDGIKRAASSNETFRAGVVDDIASTAIELSENLYKSILRKHSHHRRWVLISKGDFDEKYQQFACRAFSEFSGYCNIVLEEAAIATDQKQLYRQEYPVIQQRLEEMFNNLTQLASR